MQFTGLKDKNGKEIYEGDVLNIGSDSFGFITNGKNEDVNYIVVHEGCNYVLQRPDINLKWGNLGRLSEINWYCKISSNIHDNPELL